METKEKILGVLEMIDKTVNLLQDIELLEKIEPIAEKIGLEADDIVFKCTDGDVLLYSQEKDLIAYTDRKEVKANGLKTYTSSSLELLLPEWAAIAPGYSCHIRDYFYAAKHGVDIDAYKAKDFGMKFIDEAAQYENKAKAFMNTSRGKQKVEALARLIILLDEEGLLKCQ